MNTIPSVPTIKPFKLPDSAKNQFTQALNRGLPSFIPIKADSGATYTNPYAGQPNVQSGNFGAGGGGANRYDYTQPGSGLYSIGIDRSSPTAINDANRWYQAQDPATRAEIGALAGRNVNDPVGLLNAIDARQRDVARKITKTNGFMDSTFGQLLGIGLPMAAGGLFGPLAAMGTSAAVGGARGGPMGALLGGLSSAIAPNIAFPSLGDAIRAPIRAATNVARQFANPVNLGRQALSSSLGGIKTRNG